MMLKIINIILIIEIFALFSFLFYLRYKAYKAKEETGLPVVTEIMSPCDIPKFIEKADHYMYLNKNVKKW